VLHLLPCLPFPRDPDGNVRLQQTVRELLPFLDLDAVYHEYGLCKDRRPCESAYHFQLFTS
jgi:hypothetical protein